MIIGYGWNGIGAMLKQLNIENAQQLIESWYKIKHRTMYKTQNGNNIK